jgi:proline dehydrogenase
LEERLISTNLIWVIVKERARCSAFRGGAVGLFGKMMVTLLPITPKFIVGWVAKRYVAGKDLQSAVAKMKKLGKKEGCCFTVDVLGEEISSLEEAAFFLAEYERVIDAIGAEGLDANISIKPTAFGLLIDEEVALSNVQQLLEKAAEHEMFVRLDMEDHRVTQSTIDVVLKMHERGLTNVGIVLQARLFRTIDDINAISETLGDAADIRLCKGIYLEGAEIAHTGYNDINTAFSDALKVMLANGSYCAIATHDKPVVADSLKQLQAMNMGPTLDDPREDARVTGADKGPGYEFQMLLGVRGELRRQLLKQGHRVRIYIPYGKRWYEYSMRRLRENPDIAWHITKSFLMPWSK